MTKYCAAKAIFRLGWRCRRCYEFTVPPLFLNWRFLLSYTCGRYVLNGRTVRLQLAYSYVSLPYHMSPVCVLVFPHSCFTCFPVLLLLDSRLVYPFSSLSCLLFVGTRYSFGFTTRLSTRYFWTCGSSMTRFPFTNYLYMYPAVL